MSEIHGFGCVVIAIAKAYSSSSVIYVLNLNGHGCIEHQGYPFLVRRLCQKDGQYVWPNEEIVAEKVSNGSILRCRDFGKDYVIYLGNTNRQKVSLVFHEPRNL